MNTLTITKLGALGDGIAQHGGRDIFVPYALPDEIVDAKIAGNRATIQKLIEPSAQRQTPICKHFGQCGGCTSQHMSDAIYASWKRDIVVHALRVEGVDADIAPLITCATQTRRRAVFAAENTQDGFHLGFNKAQSHDLVPIDMCSVLVPAIIDKLPELQRLGAILAAGRPIRFKMIVLASQNGLDVTIEDLNTLSEEMRKAAIRYVVAEGFARLTFKDELLIETKSPNILFGDVVVKAPAGGFLQAVASAEEAMAALVSQHLKSSKSIADLFAGSGTFALRLAKKARVFAVEFDSPALNALEHAKRFAIGLKTLTHERRDLFRRPLLPRELLDYDAVVFDPPRAGAEAQCKSLAKSKVAKVAAVSCNPQTLARDLKILVDGGYRIDSITPIDQFLWSPHVEVVALLSKKSRR